MVSGQLSVARQRNLMSQEIACEQLTTDNWQLTNMKIQQFLDHHGIAANPFAEEDAQTDPVFKEHCIASMYHPAWDKIYGDPADPATSVVFGEKGLGQDGAAAANRPASGRLQSRASQSSGCSSSSTTTSIRFSIAFKTGSAAGGGGSIGCSTNGSCGITWMRSCRWA